MTPQAPVVTRAQALAQQTVETYSSNTAIADCLPPDAFMAHRPKTLAESYQHGAAVAQTLAQWQAEPALQAAGLLHSFVCKGVLPAEQIVDTCNERTAFLCQTYWHILQQTPEQQRGKAHVIKRVKLFIAAYRDPALAFLSVASLRDHFVLARQSDPSLQRLFANEAREVMLPLLDMLGMWQLKTEVERWVMKRGQSRQDYQHLEKRLWQTEKTRVNAFEQVKQKLQPELPPTARLSYKPPTPAQIYRPHLPEKAHQEAFQKLTVDVLVGTEEACYTALRWIHRFWPPVEYSLVDHIGLSKLNGFRCLQTTVIVPLGSNHVRADFNIRTYEMEQINKWGLAALLMKERQNAELTGAWWRNREEGVKKISSAPLGGLPETLYVFSPQGQLFRFHRGCTVVDYAYQVHSELAHQCKRFKINGEGMSATTVLRHLDLVELERDPQFPGPNKAWLNAARTDRARSHIERFLKRQSQGHLQGQQMINRQLKELSEHYRIDIPEHRVEQALKQATRQRDFERTEHLLAEIAAGRVSTDPILHPLFAEEVVRQLELSNGARLLPHQMNLAQCCKPRPGDDIIGRAKYRDGQMVRLKIHRADCPRIAHLPGAIELQWRLQPQLNTVARLEVIALAEDNLLLDTLKLLHVDMPQITLHKVESISRNGIARLSFTVEARDQQLIDKIKQNLENLSGYKINQVRQMQLLFSEREELARPTTPAYNPYRRHPVRDRDMFFGRTEELAAIYELLNLEAGVIFVQGQKRVGKTSLLLHLTKHYLNRRPTVPVFIDFQMLGSLTPPTLHYELAHAVYNSLQANTRIVELEPPLKDLFEMDPTPQLIDYLKNAQSHLGVKKLVLLIDEFSRTIDAYRQNKIDDTLFQQWRGVIQATVPNVSYVMVVQQQTFNHLRRHQNRPDVIPIWHLLELGETLLLKPLSESDARQLIERPTYNHLEYTPQAIRYVWRLTGGRPFLIHAFCFNLVRHLAHQNRRQVGRQDVDTVQAEFMHPHESLFAHLIDVIKEIPHAVSICKQLTRQLRHADRPVALAEIHAALPQIPDTRLRNSLQKLTDQHILIEPEPDKWQFASLLFGRWLAVNTVLD